MQQRVVQRDPDFPISPVHTQCREDALERRVLPFAFLAHDLLARGLRRRHGLQRGVLNVLSRITQAVILPHRRLRQVSKRIVEVALDVRGQLPDVQIAVQFRALRKRFGVAELAHVSSVLVEDDDQVWLAQRRYGNFSFGEGGNGDRRVHRNRTKKRTIRRKYLNEIRAAIRHVNLPVGAAVAVFTEGDQCAARLGAGVSAGKLADGENLLALRVKHQQAR